MKKFIVIYHDSEESVKKMQNSTPEQMKEEMQRWMKWAQSCGDGLVDMGTPLGNGQSVRKDGSVSQSNKHVVGYSILQAENMDKALAMMKGHPHLQWAAGCEIEVHEALPLPGE